MGEGNLLDASTRIYVMCLVAFLNLKAWWPWRRWYKVARTMDFETQEVDDEAVSSFFTEKHPSLDLLEKLFCQGKGKEPRLTTLDIQVWSKVKEHVEVLKGDALLQVLHRGAYHSSHVYMCTEDGKALTSLTDEERRKHLLKQLEIYYPDRQIEMDNTLTDRAAKELASN